MSFLLTTLNAKYIHTNLAIRILYQLNKQHKDLSWKEFTIKENQDEVADYCATFDVVAFSCYIWNITQTLEVCEKIKSRNPDCKILLGGPEVSYEYEEIIVKPSIDFIIVGEGEEVFQQFLQLYPNVGSIAGLVQKEDDTIAFIRNESKFDIDLLNTINPYADDCIEELANKVLYIETSRGCPYKCEFCLASLDNKVRYLHTNRIKENLLFLMKHGKTIKFLDRTFNIKRDFTIEVFDFILQHYNSKNVFQFEITADILHQDIIQFINEKVPKGLFRFEIGIQTVNQLANLEVSRKQNFAKTSSIVHQVRDKVELHLDLIVGLPLDYWSDIKFSIEEVFKLHPPELQLGFLKFLKGTPMRTKAALHKYRYDSTAPYQLIESMYLSKEELQRILKLEHALEVYWNKKRILNTLNYIIKQHSIFDFLLNLGIYYDQKHKHHHVTLEDIYKTVYEFASESYPHNAIILQLIAIDYYLQHRIKPKKLFVDELDKKSLFEIINHEKWNHHQNRYIGFYIDFDWDYFLATHSLKLDRRVLIICYSRMDAKVMCAYTLTSNQTGVSLS